MKKNIIIGLDLPKPTFGRKVTTHFNILRMKKILKILLR